MSARRCARLKPIVSFAMLRRDSCAAICDFEEWPRRRSEPSDAQLDIYFTIFQLAVLCCVFAQVPDDLAQLRGIDLYFHIAQQRGDGEPLGRNLHGGAELIAETCQPG